jgi:hypothetical protein
MNANADLINDMLTNTRINWRRVAELGGDIEAIRYSAALNGDTVLARRAARHLAARA